MSVEQQKTQKWYQAYYEKKGADRNHVLNNPEVLFQWLAYKRCFVEAFRGTSRGCKFLDVGGGGGAGILSLMELGFPQENVSMVDIQHDRVAEAQKRFPLADIRLEDACALSFADSQFDCVFQSTMFVQLEESTAENIALEMIRVAKPGGRIVLFDWRYDGGKAGYTAVTKARVKRLFKTDSATRLERVHRTGPLVPPLGRFLSKYAPSIYFCFSRLPVLTGLVAYVLIKDTRSHDVI